MRRTATAGMSQALQTWLARLFGAEREEADGVVASFAMFFLLFAGYFMLRPVRETMGIAGGVENLQWLFTGTFFATLAAMPLFGWIAGRVQRRRILYWVYGFFTLILIAFGASFLSDPDDVWVARTFYIWLSVFNLIAISVAWSVLVDVFSTGQAKRLFALMAAGASLGGLIGPLLGVFLVGPVGHAGLIFLSAALLVASAVAARRVQRWRERHPLAADDATQRQRPLGGSPFAGATEVLSSPYLLGIARLRAAAGQRQHLPVLRAGAAGRRGLPGPHRPDPRVRHHRHHRADAVDPVAAVHHRPHRAQFGVGVLLVAVPLIAATGFLWLAFAPTFAVLAVVMVVRRAGEYAFVRPGREMLYTVVEPEAKYKAKNFNDTVVYRGADAVSGWVKAGIDMLAQQPTIAMLIGAAIALAWGLTGGALGRAQRRIEAATAALNS